MYQILFQGPSENFLGDIIDVMTPNYRRLYSGRLILAMGFDPKTIETLIWFHGTVNSKIINFLSHACERSEDSTFALECTGAMVMLPF
jgi:hypothetical protein